MGVLFLVRGPAFAHGDVWAILRALPSALVAGFAWRLAPQADWPMHALAVVAVGGALTVSSLAALGRSFAIFPAARDVVERGPYRLVRHPAYLGEVVMVAGCGLAHAPSRGVLASAITVALLAPRILDEETLLGRHPGYGAYRARVRFRLVPGLW